MSSKRRRLTPDEMEQALAFKLTVIGRGCEIHDDPLDCELPIQACHVIPKQSLRRRGLYEHVYDPRNGVAACYRAHRRSDAGIERFPVETFSREFWQFADELDLTWLVEKLYGARVAA